MMTIPTYSVSSKAKGRIEYFVHTIKLHEAFEIVVFSSLN